MRRRSASIPLLLLSGIVAGCSDDDVTGQRTVRVGLTAGADFASIQGAVDAVSSGGTILVDSGVYVEWVDVSKTVTIVGSGPGTVVEYPADGPTDAAVIRIHDVSDLRIEALSVRASRSGVDGIRVRDATSVVLQSIVASSTLQDGIDVRRSSGISIVSGTMENNGGDGIQVDEGSNSVRIASNRTASNGGDGIKVSFSGGVLIEFNVTALNGDDGILVRNSNNVEIRENTVANNSGWGISVHESPDTVLAGNTVVGNGSGDVMCDPDPCP